MNDQLIMADVRGPLGETEAEAIIVRTESQWTTFALEDGTELVVRTRDLAAALVPAVAWVEEDAA